MHAARVWRPHWEAKLRRDPLGALLDLVTHQAVGGSLVVDHARLRAQLEALTPAQHGEIIARAQAAPQRRCSRCYVLCCGRRQRADVC